MKTVQRADMAGTEQPEYTQRLKRLGGVWWKRLFDVQRPYRWNVRRLRLGRTLDVGCGIGRNLAHLGGNAVGIDHNASSVAEARARGFVAYTPDQFRSAPEARPASFDTLLLSHVAEHMAPSDCVALLEQYAPFLRPRGRVVLMTPQEAGQRYDPTHMTFVDFERQREILKTLDCTVEKQYSFPLPRPLGRVFTHNEFVGVGRRRS